jgi:ATP synthase protein I
MTTAPSTTSPRSGRGPVVAVVRTACVWTVLAGLLASVLAGFLASGSGVRAAVLGTAMVCLFFGAGTLVVDAVSALAPVASLLVALLTYTLQVLAFAVMFLALTRSGALGSFLAPRWLAGTVIACTLVWLTAQTVGSLRMRQPLYDLPSQDAGAR